MWLSGSRGNVAFVRENKLYWSNVNSHDGTREWSELRLPEGYTANRCCLSGDGAILAISVTSDRGSALLVYDFPSPSTSEAERSPTVNIPVRRCLSSCRFTPDSENLITADRSGQVNLISVKNQTSEIITAHLSMILVAELDPGSKFLVTTDRDEKIRVSNYPECENIEAYCLGHKEFVSCFEFCPTDSELAVSGGGDGLVILWHWQSGRKLDEISISTSADERSIITDIDLPCLPISFVAWYSSFIFVSLKRSKRIQIFSVKRESGRFKLISEAEFETSGIVTGLVISDDVLLVTCEDSSLKIECWNISNPKECRLIKSDRLIPESELKNSEEEDFTILYKRKFDNVADYYERKKQRLNQTKNSVTDS